MNKLILISVFLAGCASQDILKMPEGIKISTDEMVKGCELKGDVHGVSALYGVFIEKGIANARVQAFNQAKALGANNVVLLPIKTGTGSTEASGNAYYCQ